MRYLKSYSLDDSLKNKLLNVYSNEFGMNLKKEKIDYKKEAFRTFSEHNSFNKNVKRQTLSIFFCIINLGEEKI